jgi:DNA polymerase-1
MSIETKEKLVLLDAYAILHRAFHALPSFTSRQTGEPTGALYGFTAFLLKTIRELKPDYLVACYDLAEPTFRHIAYEQYKAQRPQKEDILIKQIDRSRDIIKVFNIPIYDSPGFEADDMLGTIVEQVKFKIKIIIASGDLDTLQLVKDDEVVVYTFSKGIKETVVYNEEKVYERFGFGPELITDFKALKGDPSDNIIGVRGIGEKTAIELIKNFGTIENLYKILKNSPEKLKQAGIKERIIKLLEENEEEAMFSKTLAEIRKDAPIKFSLEQSKWREFFDIEKIKLLFNELGFKSLIDRLPS